MFGNCKWEDRDGFPRQGEEGIGARRWHLNPMAGCQDTTDTLGMAYRALYPKGVRTTAQDVRLPYAGF